MNLSHILAIDDVRLAAVPDLSAEVETFYTKRLGLERLRTAEPDIMVFRGYPRSGPRLMVKLTDDLAREPSRRLARIQVKSLDGLLEDIEKESCPREWVRGLSLYERRLSVLDPAGNRLELVESHPL
jgi:hypothetical protein